MLPSRRSSPDSLADAFTRETGCELRVRRVGGSTVLVPEPDAVERYGRFGIDAQLSELDAVLRRLTCAA